MNGVYRIYECPQAGREHRKDKRQYAHVDHFKDAICVSKTIWQLPDKHFYGIFAHEVGHLIAKGKSEAEANEAMLRAYGITIRYKDCRYGKNLEYLDLKDLKVCKKLFTFN